MHTLHAVTLKLLTMDETVVALFDDLAAQFDELSIHVCPSDSQARLAIAQQPPDILFIDEDLGHDVVCRTIRYVREKLCQDWLPIVTLSDSAEVHHAISADVPGHIDFAIPKPLTVAALRERQSALRRMVALRRISRSALDRVSEGVIVIDERGAIRSFNGAAEALFGWSAAEVTGRNISMLLPPGHSERHDSYLDNYHRSGKAQIIGVGRVEDAMRKDGSRFRMHLTVADISDSTARRFVGVVRDLTLHLQRDELEAMTRHDSLTGLPNRAYVNEALEALVQRWSENPDDSAAQFSVLFCDLDHFKPVNDRHGHRVGDEVLKAVAQRLRQSVSGKDFVARLAGDEFLILLHGVSDEAAARSVADRLSAAIRQPIGIGELQVSVGLSIGVATVRDTGADAQRLMEHADQGMYHAKKSRSSRGAAQVSPP
ncbi:MAG: diguanylate cyclase [Gammaproteobacteria bacterium]|jgi:diguanylate cyclase (GGDEF)-like protein/PAS domain S-box-containing protein|nr:diguanylate cyclase [Gammaproteobacteria bacterium]MBU0771001.1 diguanylate cyclase [Gammaproteobacteria bacterium]MBU0857799.1 diguanylate cyclase [Gammaproteobacteria bacterium]MBU1846047.1 diguanylate cyclase [Gammaproteobacteria bacterium]